MKYMNTSNEQMGAHVASLYQLAVQRNLTLLTRDTDGVPHKPSIMLTKKRGRSLKRFIMRGSWVPAVLMGEEISFKEQLRMADAYGYQTSDIVGVS